MDSGRCEYCYNSMKRFNLTTHLVTVLGGIACLPLAGHAGDALIFPSTPKRTNSSPTAINKVAREADLDVTKVPVIDPTLMIDRGNYNAPRDPRADRRAKNARLEAKEWITFDKGELSARDAEKGEFGIRDEGGP